MKRILFLLALLCLEKALHAQTPYVYTIKADSVKITNSCDTAELIIENHTQNVPGFLFNKGRGRTEFRRGLLKVTDSMYIVGGDTLKMNPWLQGGNRFGTTGVFGTMDNSHIDFFTNGLQRGRLTNNGALQIGNNSWDNNDILQVGNNGSVTIAADLSRSTDRIQIGKNINGGDGQNIIIRTSNDNGATYRNLLVERNGNIGLGISNRPTPISGWVVGNPALRIFDNGLIDFGSTATVFGNPNGPPNSSALVTYVSNPTEWQQGDGNYPSRANYYYFGTVLYGATPVTNVRAPLRISGLELQFYSGPVYSEGTIAATISENQNLLLGTTTDNGNRLQVTGNANVTGNVTVSGNTIKFAGLSGDNSMSRILAADVNGNLFFRDASTLALNENINSDLAVNGRISAQKMLITQTGRWPDYVFSKDYKLPGLNEVEKFIKQNSHLPGIPSAVEVEKKGIDVAANQEALLKKIEELTLYVIELNKTVQQQQKEILELKNKK
jgi:hypothetical protein